MYGSPGNEKEITTVNRKCAIAFGWAHFMRNLLAHIPSGEKTLVAALVRTIFVQPHRQTAGQQVAETLRLMRERWPQAAAVLAEDEDDVTAYMSFPVEHWSRIYSTNPLERLHCEIRRRTDMVGVGYKLGSRR